MARQKILRLSRVPIHVHEDTPELDDRASDLEDTEQDAASDSDLSLHNDDASDEEMDDSVAEDIERFQLSFKDLSDRYRLINRIGEGWYSNFGLGL
jgi:hypothetical protein